MANSNSKETLNDRIIKRLNLKAEGNGKKPFYKSVRFGYDVFEAIDAVEGDSFNEVFANICDDYIRTIPERERRVKELEMKIKDKQKQLEKLDKAIRDMQWLVNGVEDLRNQFQRVNKLTEPLIKAKSE